MRKKLFAILMSAMMMVTFMPAMAFAYSEADAAKVVWGEGFKTVTYDGTEYPTTLNAITYNNSGSGDVEVAGDAGTGSRFYGEVRATINTKGAKGVPTDISTKFFDLSTAKAVNLISEGYAAESDLAYSSLPYDDFKALYTAMGTDATVGVRLAFDVPSYVGNYAAAKNATAMPNFDTGDDYSAEMTVPYVSDETRFANTTYTMNIKVNKPAGALDWKTDTMWYGAAPAKVLVARADTPALGDAKYYLDGKSTLECMASSTTAVVDYDAADHTVVQAAIPGIASTYSLLNETTGLFEAVDAVKVKNAGTYTFNAKQTLTTAAAVTSQTFDGLQVVINRAHVPTVGLPATANVKTGFDAKALVKVTAYGQPTAGTTPTAKQVADKKATDANAALFIEYINDVYDVVVEPSKTVDEQGTVKLVAKADNGKTWTNAEKDALVTKYAPLFANFCTAENTAITVNRGNVLSALTPSAQQTTYDIVASDIEWVKAPLTKTYHVKKAKGLKKAKTIQVEAVADSKVTYKLQYGGSQIKIDKATGKITLKKGLKKGTYKVVVTASAKASGSAGSKVSDSYVLKIKVKK